jgi:hypothetical protein
MHGPINVKSPNNIIKRQMGLNSAFKGLTIRLFADTVVDGVPSTGTGVS